MKIGFVVDDTLDRNDGVQQYVLLLGRWLKKHGHEVHYLTSETARPDLQNIHSLAKNIKVSFNKNVLAIPLRASTKRIRAILSEERFDVLHVQMPYSPSLAAKIIKNKPISTTLVGTFHIAPYSQAVTVSNRLLAILLKSTLAKFNAIISVSPVAQQFAKHSFKIQSQVIPNAIDTARWKSASSRNIDILFLGRLVPRKGCHIFLQSMRILKDQGILKNVRCVIVGDGPQRKKLELFALKYDLQENVTFKGYVTEDEKRRLLQHAKVSVFPSTGGESFGIVLLEAMAAGNAVIAADNPGYKSVMGDLPDSLVRAADPRELAEKIRYVLQTPGVINQLSSRQLKMVHRYDINVVGDAILAVYKDAIRKSQR